MFSNNVRPDPYAEEGIVLQVDSSGYCRVHTQQGQILDAVPWASSSGGSSRGGDRSTPSVGDRVYVDFRLGHPIILCFLPRAQVVEGSTPATIGSGTSMPHVGTYGPSDVVKIDANKPSDLHPGDKVISSSGGAMIAALRGGSILARASKSAEMFLSKLTSLVRIVSRNWEHFTDVNSDIVRNFQGRVYRYTGYAKTFLAAKASTYIYHQYVGDVTAAEAVKDNYGSFTGVVPAQSDVVFKEQIADGANALMYRTIDVDGNEEVWVKVGTEFTRMKAMGDSLTFSWKDLNSIVITEDSIHVFHGGGADLVMDVDQIKLQIGGSIAKLTPDDILLVNGAGETFVSPDETRLKNGDHSVTVTSAGVAIV